MTRQRRPRAFMFSIIAVVIWLGIGGVLGPVSGKLADVQKNQNSDFLPENAESAKAQKLIDGFKAANADDLPLTVVFEKTSGALTQADKDGIDAAVQTALRKPNLSKIVRTVDLGNGTKVPAVFPANAEQQMLATSKDGEAYVVNVLVDGSFLENGEGFQQITDIAEEAKGVLEQPVPGVTGYVTGAVGIVAELAGAFGNIDTVLLGVTVIVVAVILIFVYRSPFLWFFPLLSAGLALTTAQGAIYWLAKHEILTLNGQSQGILTVLVFGAATDYALLLIARYREELRHEESKFHAMANALRGVWEPIAASAGTVAVGLMCLQLSDLKSNSGLGPVGAVGVLSALVVLLTFLPAVLVLVGRRVFWPFVPHFGTDLVETKGMWGKIARGVGRHPNRTWIASAVLLVILAGFSTTLKAEGLADTDVFTNKQASAVKGITVLAKHDLVNPSPDANVVINASALERTLAALATDPAVARTSVRSLDPATGAAQIVDGKALVEVYLQPTKSAEEGQAELRSLRDRIHAIDGADALVGGQAASNLDVQDASRHDRKVIIPIVLLVIMVILMLLLRSILAPILLIGTVVLSYFATLGASAIAFNHVFGFVGADASFPLFAFVFLVALGIDYNIFLMTRVREESQKLGTREGTLKALAVTGGVITSAGIVLAATFSVLGVLPLVFLAETGFAVAFGVLLDTMIVRSLLVPALTYDFGKRIWWPSRLSKDGRD